MIVGETYQNTLNQQDGRTVKWLGGNQSSGHDGLAGRVETNDGDADQGIGIGLLQIQSLISQSQRAPQNRCRWRACEIYRRFASGPLTVKRIRLYWSTQAVRSPGENTWLTSGTRKSKWQGRVARAMYSVLCLSFPHSSRHCCLFEKGENAWSNGEKNFSSWNKKNVSDVAEPFRLESRSLSLATEAGELKAKPYKRPGKSYLFLAKRSTVLKSGCVRELWCLQRD